jgi:hypothetical protein
MLKKPSPQSDPTEPGIIYSYLVHYSPYASLYPYDNTNGYNVERKTMVRTLSYFLNGDIILGISLYIYFYPLT